MKCPHCLAELRYKERPDRKCPKCQGQFALEPRDNVLEMSDLRLRGLADRLSIQGIYRYTVLQLGYTAAWKKIKKETGEQISLRSSITVTVISGVILVAGMLGGHFFEPAIICSFVAMFGFIGLMIFGTSSIRLYNQSLNPPLHRFLPLLASFEEQFVVPWERFYGTLPGRLTAQEIAALRQLQLPLSEVRAVLACPVDDILDCLRANGLPKSLGLALINPERPTDADEAIIALLRSHPQIPLLLVHDASVDGCLLPALLPARWGLASHHRIVDLGLSPRQAQKLRLPWMRKEVPKELINLLERRAQKQNGLPLTPEEIEWLRNGFVTSVLFIAPARLVDVVARAVERLTPKRIVDPEAQAQAVGFMTWPS